MTEPEVHAPVTGAQIGPWRILERTGSGTFGIVYRVCLAEEPGAGEYALKVAREPGDPRFEREGELLLRIRHPHVPGLRDRGLWQGGWRSWYPYLVMQWVEGLPLYLWARRRGVTSRQCLQVLSQVARALEATHKHGVHRDVKGDNVLVSSDGNAVLVDYGCCWYEGARALTEGFLPPGTRPYRSPQALRHERQGNPETHYTGTAADDIYALGVTAYYLVTGTYPPPGRDSEDGARRPLLPPSELASVAPELEVLILRMLSEEPQARGTAGELAEALEHAAKSAGPGADMRMQPSRAMLPTERAVRPGPTRWHLASQAVRRHAGLLAVAGTLAAGLLAVVLLPPFSGLDVKEPAQLAEAEEAEEEEAGADERAVGLADGGVDEVLVAAEARPAYGGPAYGLVAPLPKTPLPGQRRPPCLPTYQRAINGLCWWIMPKPPPCEDAYEHDNKCYTAVVPNTRQPTSEEP
jgi:hypothetical protein